MEGRKKRKVIPVAAFLFLSMLMMVAACGSKNEQVVLQTPVNLQINGTTLTWDEVENASGYMVRINEAKEITGACTYDLSALIEPGSYEIQVKSLGKEKESLASDWSEIKEYRIEPEQSLEFAPADLTNSYQVVGIGTVRSDEIVIPDTYNGYPVTVIGYRAFENNVRLKKVVLPDTIKCILSLAFAGCTGLESIDLPNGLENIQSHAFSGSGLRKLELPDSVTNVPYGIIDNCLNLESFGWSNGLRDVPIRFFENTPKIKSTVLPDSIGMISTEAFVGSSIESIKIPKNVSHIFKRAFKDTNIHSVEFEKGSVLTDIKENAFEGCRNLQSIEIPASVTDIGPNAFSDCPELKNVTFEENSQLKSLDIIFAGSSITGLNIPRSVTVIKSEAFANLSTLETIRFEDNSELDYISGSAFLNCVNLTTVDFGKNSKLRLIAGSVFENCTKLALIEIPETVTLLGNKVFGGCLAIKSIIVPAGVKTMGRYVFSGWTEDQIIYFAKLTEAPSGWHSEWFDSSDATVVWNYQSETF